MRELLTTVQEWADQRPDISGIGMSGSWARDAACMDSDVDWILLTHNPTSYIEDDTRITDLGGFRITKTEQWEPMTERRFFKDRFRVLYDPDGLLARLVGACQ